MENEKLILRSLRYILLKWGSTDTKATEIIFDINKVLNPEESPSIPDQTKSALSEDVSRGKRE